MIMGRHRIQDGETMMISMNTFGKYIFHLVIYYLADCRL